MNSKIFSLKTLLVVLIVGLLSYLIYKNVIENKTVESFKQNYRNSLSSYFQSDDDTDYSKDANNLRTELRNTKSEIIFVQSRWNGTWKFANEQNKNYYITFIQVNKSLLFVINKESYVIEATDGQSVDPYVVNSNNNKQCLPDMVIASAELNSSENLFYLKHIYCSNNGDATGELNIFGTDINDDTINNFYGYLTDDNKVEIVQNGTDGSSEVGKAICEKVNGFKYGQSAEYLLRTSYNLPTPNFKNSIILNADACKNTYFDDYKKGDLSNCYITDGGLPTPADKNEFKSSTEGNYSYNDYGTGCALKKDIVNKNGYANCPTDIKETCFIPLNNDEGTQTISKVQSYKKCITSFDMNIKNQASITYPFYMKEKTNNNLLDVCQHLAGFQSGKYNAAVVMYVDRLSNIETLDFDFFGISQGENYLTTKLDMMFPFMNNNILNEYRDDISDEKSLRLTNCIENNMSTINFNDLLTTCSSEYANVKTNYDKLKSQINQAKANSENKKLKDSYNSIKNLDDNITQQQVNRLIHPTVWSLEFEKNLATNQTVIDYTNDCSFILSTSDKYNKESRFQKYAEFESGINKTRLNLQKGGNKQKLILENPYIIDSLEMKTGSTSVNNSNNISNDYILMSGNLRTYQPKKYLVPGQGNNLGNFGKEIYLQNDVRPSGKWVILGMNLTENLDRANSKYLNTKTLVKTLKKISDTINSN